MAEEEAPLAVNYIPVVLKKRKNNEQWAIRRKLQQEEKAKRQKPSNFIIKKPEQFIREYRDKELDLVQMKSRGKRSRLGSVTSPESKLLFVIRIREKNDMHPNTRKILYSLRLRKIFSGVFVKANEEGMKMLQKVEPYVTYGYTLYNMSSKFHGILMHIDTNIQRKHEYRGAFSICNYISCCDSHDIPNMKSVKDLIYKKGVVRIDKQKIPLTDNNIVEQELGEHNIICIEDIVNEVVNVGSHFKAVTSFLCPFKLSNPEKALQGKKKRFEDGGDSGNRKDQINDLLGKMN